MPLNKHAIKAVVFDYGSTLIEFGRTQVALCDAALADLLVRLYGPHDQALFRELRDQNRRAPYSGAPPLYKENDLAEITRGLVHRLYGREPAAEQVAEILRMRFEVFVRTVRAPDYAAGLLRKLGRRYRLGLLSNYPDGQAIRASLDATGLARFFRAVVVSADVGLVKPHPVPFITLLGRLGVRPSEAVLVGDNWLADVQGAKRAGWQAVWCRQWETPEDLPRREGDAEPDATIRHLSELETLL